MSTKSVSTPKSPTPTRNATVIPIPAVLPAISNLIEQYGCGPVQFYGTEHALYERHLFLDHVAPVVTAASREWITDLRGLRKLEPLAHDHDFRGAFPKAKRKTNLQFAVWHHSKTGHTLDPYTIVDRQVKRIHG